MFDNVVLNKICEFVNDPQTFYNFSLVCRKFYNVSRIHKNYKMDTFLTYFGPGADTDCRSNGSILSLLPNDKPHGVHTILSDYDPRFDSFQLFYNGDHISNWKTTDATIHFKKCNCQTSEYIFKKIGIPLNSEFTLEGANAYICKVCKQHYNKFIVEKIKLNK